MSRNFLMTLIMLSLISSPLFSQPLSQSQTPSRIRRYEVGGSSIDSMMEYALDTIFAINGNYANDKRLPGKAIIKLCSKRPMPIAIATAALDPVLFARFVSSNYSFPLDKLIISRSDDCLGKEEATAASELWAIPDGQQLPQTIESIKSCQIRLRYIESEHPTNIEIPFRRTYNHRKSIKRLIDELKMNPKTIGIVIGYHLGNPTKMLRTRLQEARRILSRSGLPPERYFSQLMIWPGWPEQPTPKYLSVMLVEIVPECLTPGTEDEIIKVK